MKQEIGREEEIYGRTDHWLSAGSRVGLASGGSMPPARLLGGQLLPLAQQIRWHERLRRQAPQGVDASIKLSQVSR